MSRHKLSNKRAQLVADIDLELALLRQASVHSRHRALALKAAQHELEKIRERHSR